jgi:hypothetical protein
VSASRPPEGPRDELETAFTPILRRIRKALPGALAVAFVDQEGECIDYVGSLDAFDIKVSAAHAGMLMDRLRGSQHKLGLVQPLSLHVAASGRELWARRVTDEHVLVAQSGRDVDALQAWTVLSSAAEEFRSEIGVGRPAWEPPPPLEVWTRDAVGWPFAPAAFTEHGARTEIGDVLGRWTEPCEGVERAPAAERTCFRIRTADGRELTLVHDPQSASWEVRP